MLNKISDVGKRAVTTTKSVYRGARLRLRRWAASSRAWKALRGSFRSFRLSAKEAVVGNPIKRVWTFAYFLIRTRNWHAASASGRANLGSTNPPGADIFANAIAVFFVILFSYFLWQELVTKEMLNTELLAPIATFWSIAKNVPSNIVGMIDAATTEGVTKYRNIGLMLVGAIGVPLLFWRTLVAHKQGKLADTGLDVDRFRKGCELLTDDHYTARYAGIITLKELALSKPKQYEPMVLEVLVNYLRMPDGKGGNTDIPSPSRRPDLHQALRAVLELWRNPATRARYVKIRGRLDLKNIVLKEADMSRAILRYSDMSGCAFTDCNFSYAELDGACLSDVIFNKCDLQFANLKGANLTRTDFRDNFCNGMIFAGSHLCMTQFGSRHPNVPSSDLSMDQVDGKWFRGDSADDALIGLDLNEPPMAVKAHKWGPFLILRVSEAERGWQPINVD